MKQRCNQMVGNLMIIMRNCSYMYKKGCNLAFMRFALSISVGLNLNKEMEMSMKLILFAYLLIRFSGWLLYACALKTNIRYRIMQICLLKSLKCF